MKKSTSRQPKYGPNGKEALDFQGKDELQIIKHLAKTDGFIQVYWHNLKYYRTTTQKELFNTLNDFYEKLFEEPRYKNYDSFRKSLAWHLRK